MSRPSLLLVHGAATGAWMWDHWRRHLGSFGWQVNVLDLRGHGRSMPTDLASVTLEDYVKDIASVAPQIEAAQGHFPVIGGWGMGGLLALMYAAIGAKPPAILLMAPLAPVEVAGKASIEVVRAHGGELLGPSTFGPVPDDLAASQAALRDLDEAEVKDLLAAIAGEQESGIAYRQALRGVSVPEASIDCPALTLYAQGDPGWTPELTSYLNGDSLAVPVAGPWGIVRHEAAVQSAAAEVDTWLQGHLAVSTEE